MPRLSQGSSGWSYPIETFTALVSESSGERTITAFSYVYSGNGSMQVRTENINPSYIYKLQISTSEHLCFRAAELLPLPNQVGKLSLWYMPRNTNISFLHWGPRANELWKVVALFPTPVVPSSFGRARWLCQPWGKEGTVMTWCIVSNLIDVYFGSDVCTESGWWLSCTVRSLVWRGVGGSRVGGP